MKTDFERNAILARIITSIIFGCSFLFSKEGLAYFSAVQLLSCRFLVAAGLLYMLKKTKVLKVTIGLREIVQSKVLIVLVLFQPVAGYYFEMQGVDRLSAAESGVILALIPIFVTVMGIKILGEKPNKRQGFCICLSFLGVLFILVIKGEPTSQSSFAGFAFFLISAACAAAFNIFSRKAAKSYTYVDITYSMMVAGAIFFSTISLIEHLLGIQAIEVDIFCQTPSVIGAVLFLGIMSSVVGFLLTNYSLSVMNAFRVAVFNNLAMIIAIVVGVVVAQASFTWIQILGSITVMLGVCGVQYFANSKN